MPHPPFPRRRGRLSLTGKQCSPVLNDRLHQRGSARKQTRAFIARSLQRLGVLDAHAITGGRR
jgi:hypothetical protein